MTRPCYTAQVEQDGRFWLIHVPQVGHTQARHRGEVEVMARDMVALMLEVDSDSFELRVEVAGESTR